MAVDPREIKERATQLFSKGKFAKAAEAFEEYCKADERDVQARLRMGDAWAKAGKKDKAVLAYTRAAEGFAKEGFLPRAIAASKLILELDPAHQGVQKMLADLYARKSGAGRPATPKSLPSSPSSVSAPPAPAPTAPDTAAAPEAIDVEVELEPVVEGMPAPVAATEVAPPPPPAPVEVPAWELPPLVAIEVELDGAPQPPAPSAPAAIEIDVAGGEPTSGEVEIPIVSGEVAVPAPQPESNAAPDDEIEPEPDEPVAAAPPRVALPPPPPASETAAPPGLRPRRTEVTVAAEPSEPTPASTPSGRIWLPPRLAGSSPSATGASTASSPSSVRSQATSGTSELERSLEAFTQFDVDAPAPAVAEPVKVAAFTELELETDSLLQAVEAAAGRPFASSPSVSVSTEEAMEAVDEPKLEPGALPKIPLFSDLPPDAFIALFEKCPLRRAEPGHVVVEQGSHGDSFFVICSGGVKVFRTDDGKRRELATLEEGAFFGEMALLSDAPRSASVEAAREDTQLLEIPAAVLTDLSRQHPTIASALKKFCRQRLLSNLMNGATLFKPFTKSERRDLVQKFRARDVNRGETLIKEGEKSDGLYVILTGEVSVAVRGQTVAALHEGDVFGEMSLLTRTPATATVTTKKKTSLLRLPREDFDALIMSHPQILEQVAELNDSRTRANAELAKSKSTAQSVV